MSAALDLGINYIDTAAAYGKGASERYIGEALRGRRAKVFLTSKTRERRAQPIRERLFDETCQRLQTEIVDLYFLHGVHTREPLCFVGTESLLDDLCDPQLHLFEAKQFESIDGSTTEACSHTRTSLLVSRMICTLNR